MTEGLSRLRIKEIPTVRALVEQRLREAIMAGVFKPGQRLVERELCEMTGVSRPSIREALRLLEAEGLVSIVAHRGPVVSTISVEEAEQLYAARALLEGFAGRECARKKDPEIVRRLRSALKRLKAGAAEGQMLQILDAKTEFYAALTLGSGNLFVDRMLRPLHQRITLLRATSMSQPGRIGRSVREVNEILRAIESGNANRAERACIDHVKVAATAALKMLRTSPHGETALPPSPGTAQKNDSNSSKRSLVSSKGGQGRI
jgi:DNA-binding GntR family transcriptional regulator